MKAVSGNFTLSHACSHVGLPQANSLPASAAGRLQDAPSGDAGVKQAAQVDGWVGGWGGGCFGCHRVGEGILWKMPPEGLLSGENPEKSHSDRPEDSQMEGKPSRQPRSPCSNQDDGNETGVEQGRGSPFAATVWRGEIKVRGPASCPSPDKQLPPPAALPPLQPPCHAGAVKRRWGGPDLPACIWLTGDCEGALRAHVTINNPC